MILTLMTIQWSAIGGMVSQNWWPPENGQPLEITWKDWHNCQIMTKIAESWCHALTGHIKPSYVKHGHKHMKQLTCSVQTGGKHICSFWLHRASHADMKRGQCSHTAHGSCEITQWILKTFARERSRVIGQEPFFVQWEPNSSMMRAHSTGFMIAEWLSGPSSFTNRREQTKMVHSLFVSVQSNIK